MNIDFDRFETGEREVSHDFDDTDWDGYDLPIGDAKTLPMNTAQKAAARRRRARLDEIGGFGFGARFA